MDQWLIQVFSVVMVAVFWIMLAARIFVMRAKEVHVLAHHAKEKVKRALMLSGFLGILAAWSACFVTLAFVPADDLLFSLWWNPLQVSAVTWTGMLAAAASQVIIWVAIYTMGASWRIGIDGAQPGALVTRGIFKYSRNPIFLGLDLVMVAAFLIQPNGFFALFAAITGVAIHFQIRAEETHLLNTYGEEYAQYRSRTPRYIWKI